MSYHPIHPKPGSIDSPTCTRGSIGTPLEDFKKSQTGLSIFGLTRWRPAAE